MNKIEAAYAELLELRRLGGEIQKWRYEGIKLRLAHNTWYTPDFVVEMSDDTVECHEVKATWTKGRFAGKAGFKEDSRVKIKVAAQIYDTMFRFVAVHGAQRRGTWDWNYERIRTHA